jgi:hypothetical protein
MVVDPETARSPRPRSVPVSVGTVDTTLTVTGVPRVFDPRSVLPVHPEP